MSGLVVTVYSKPVCPHCVAAKEFLDAHGVPYRDVDVTKDPAALRFIKVDRGHTTVPQIYVGDRLLVDGGNAGLRALGVAALRERLSDTAAWRLTL